MKRVGVYAAFVVCAAIVIAIFQGPIALAGFSLGVSGSLINLSGLWLVIKLLTGITANQTQLNKRNGFVIAFSFLKMPLFIAAGILAWKLGSPAPADFLIGSALVYFGMIWWAFRPY